MRSKISTPVAERTPSGGFKTSDGTIYVSKPYRSKSSKKLRALVTFTPRESVFDINNQRSGSNEFRGFFSLFWISTFIFALRTYIRSIEQSGRPLNLQFFTMFSQDAVTLALSDGVLVLSTGICVPFAIALKNGWIRYYWTGLILQHIFQTSLLFAAVVWTFKRQWPWVQSGFLTLHSLVMIMKVHSYLSVNGSLQHLTQQSQSLFNQMRKTTQTLGGWDHAINTAKARRAELDTVSGISSTQGTPNGTPPVPAGSSTSYVDVKTANALHRRLSAVANLNTEENFANSNTNQTYPSPDGRLKIVQQLPGAMADYVGDTAFNPHPLVDHPNESIAAMAQDYTEMQTELTSSGPIYVTWPNNIGWKNFTVYMLIPSLVYELAYPRTERIRPLYLFEKTVATFGTFALLYTVTEQFILPYTPTGNQSIFRSLLDLALPFMMSYLLLFYIIFECICNAFAELSYFADREFYEDWWNSTTWDEFARKWNKPVHAFLLRHVYAPSISYKLSRTSAMFLTFLLSACVHELVMVIVTQKFRLYLFALQIVQVPLIALGRMPVIKQNKLLGNVIFWLGLYAGFPLLCVAYVAY